ncbi:hypothetical protein nbrc107696_41560 [Gordonia spumicola]|uniref:DUF3499 domain-containing protein n=1 Tax=Gordonia spumicola TaxID=589161 RepID=A0A7I9VFA9_9ACTN|nr:hypothetical protein nbrc107696_41560 [Gordonia spumicola]
MYAESTAVVGPLASSDEPHSWDLCAEHAERITVPRGWEMLRSGSGFAEASDDRDLTALADSVREVGSATPVGRPSFRTLPDFDDAPRGRHRATEASARTAAPTPRPGRRGHLRVLPDPVD